MATRSNLEVFLLPDGMQAGDKGFQPETGLIMLYRHWDGYPDLEAGVFATWQDFFKVHFPNGIKFYYDMPLAIITEAIKYFWIDKKHDFDEEMGRPGLELTSGLYGDIDYYYQIIFDNKNVTIKAYHREGSDNEGNFNPKGSFEGEIKIPNFKVDAKEVLDRISESLEA